MTVGSASCTVLSCCSVLICGDTYLVSEFMSFLFPLLFLFCFIHLFGAKMTLPSMDLTTPHESPRILSQTVFIIFLPFIKIFAVSLLPIKCLHSAARLIKLYKLSQFTFCCRMSKCYCMVLCAVSSFMFFTCIIHFHSCLCSCNILHWNGFLLHEKYTLILLGLTQGDSSLCCFPPLSPL